MLDPGIRMQLLIGPNKVQPAPYEVMEALRQVEVQINDDKRDGFELTFSLGRRGASPDYPLLRNGRLDPPARVTIMLIFKAIPIVLINGIITRHEMNPSPQPGQSRLRVKGEDTGLLMDFNRKKAVFRKQSDQAIVSQILNAYAQDLRPDTAATDEVPAETERITSQQDTDLGFVNSLAQRNGFRFYTEPTLIPGISTAYWGPRDRPSLPIQRALTRFMSPQDNVIQLNFEFDALAAVTPEAVTSDPSTKKSIPVSPPGPLEGQLSDQPAKALRTTQLDNTAGLNSHQASLRMRTVGQGASSTVRGTGQLDVVRYGTVLRARHRVEVRGAGNTQNGEYYVSQVTYSMTVGDSCKVSFVLERDGRGAKSSTIKGKE